MSIVISSEAVNSDQRNADSKPSESGKFSVMPSFKSIKAEAQARNYYDATASRKTTQEAPALDYSQIPHTENGFEFDKYEIKSVLPTNVLQVPNKPLPLQMVAECEVALLPPNTKTQHLELQVTFRSLEEFGYDQAAREVRLHTEFSPSKSSLFRSAKPELIAKNPVPDFDCLAGDINLVYRDAYEQALKKVGVSLSENGKTLVLPLTDELRKQLK